MVKFYYNMIILGRTTIDKIPSQYREEVQEMLDKN